MHTINLFGTIGQGYDFFSGSEAVSAAFFAAELDRAEGGPVEIRVNSDGGDVFEGQAIMNLIRLHPGETTATVVGLAASVASMLILSADHVEMAPGSQMMIHNPYSMMMGDAKEFRRQADLLDHIRDTTVIPAYQAKSGLATNEIVKMLDAETWLDADTAVELGFADSIATSSTTPVAALLREGRYAGAPAAVVALSPAQYRAELTRQQSVVRQVPLKLLRERIEATFTRARGPKTA